MATKNITSAILRIMSISYFNGRHRVIGAYQTGIISYSGHCPFESLTSNLWKRIKVKTLTLQNLQSSVLNSIIDYTVLTSARRALTHLLYQQRLDTIVMHNVSEKYQVVPGMLVFDLWQSSMVSASTHWYIGGGIRQ